MTATPSTTTAPPRSLSPLPPPSSSPSCPPAPLQTAFLAVPSAALPVANHKANAGPRPLAARTHARSNPTPSTPIESSPGPRELPGTSAGPPPTFYYRSSRAVYTQRDAPTILWPNYRLRSTGVEVWFDQSELTGGDAWDAKIRKQIKECALFVPIITPNTNARAEGYFRREWKQAAERTHDMADDVPFLFPIIIGDVPNATGERRDSGRTR